MAKKVSTFAARLREMLDITGMTQSELATASGINKSSITHYLKGDWEGKQDAVYALAKAGGVEEGWLMGYDVSSPTLPSNVTPLRPMKKVPLVGQIACGTPILAEQNIEDYIDLPGHIRADYALTCRGDSMVNAGILDGDVVYIREQPEVENGQIAAVIVDEDEATLKRFYYDGSIVQLIAENPRISPMVFSGSGIARVHVLGLAVAYTHIIE